VLHLHSSCPHGDRHLDIGCHYPSRTLVFGCDACARVLWCWHLDTPYGLKVTDVINGFIEETIAQPHDERLADCIARSRLHEKSETMC
jgi:hypothetical protein